MDNTREKLIELLTECEQLRLLRYGIEEIADILIYNGVIVLPCEIGADVWYIEGETLTVQCEKNGVAGFVIKKDEILILDSAGCEDHIGSQFCHLTKESAEKALEDMTAGCKYCKDEFCVNADCPMRADYCPVPDNPGVCRFEDRGNNK